MGALVWGLFALSAGADEPPKPGEDAPTIKVEVTGILALEKIDVVERQAPDAQPRKVKQTVLRIKGLDDYTFAIAPEMVEKAEKLANKKVVLTCTTLFALPPPPSHGLGTGAPGPPSQYTQRVRFSLFVAAIREAEGK
jgi:hypothetical protein